MRKFQKPASKTLRTMGILVVIGIFAFHTHLHIFTPKHIHDNIVTQKLTYEFRKCILWHTEFPLIGVSSTFLWDEAYIVNGSDMYGADLEGIINAPCDEIFKLDDNHCRILFLRDGRIIFDYIYSIDDFRISLHDNQPMYKVPIFNTAWGSKEQFLVASKEPRALSYPDIKTW